MNPEIVAKNENLEQRNLVFETLGFMLVKRTLREHCPKCSGYKVSNQLGFFLYLQVLLKLRLAQESWFLVITREKTATKES